MHTKTIVMTAAAVTVLAAVFVSALMRWEMLLWLVVSALLLASISLQISNRAVLSERMFAVGRKLERLLHEKAQAPAKAGGAEPRSATSTTALSMPLPARPIHKRAQAPAKAGGAELQRSSTAAPSMPLLAPAQSDRLGPDLQRLPSDPVALILNSGIFDPELYSLQVSFQFDDPAQAIRHYLRRGRRSGLLPHPLFLTSFVDPNWAKSETDPLVAYLENPQRARTTVTHPLFDPEHLDLDALPDDETPLAWFLRTADPAFPLPVPDGALRNDRTLADVWEDVSQSFAELRRVHMNSDPLRGSSEPPAFDAALHEKVRLFEKSAEQPLVSIVLPTWNRGSTIRASIDSVLEQSYPKWELLVADDGSTDDTALVVDSISTRDQRVNLLRLPHRGVSAARNSALAAAKGEFVAFLDSDKRWDRNFLRTMVAVLEMDEIDAAVAACAVTYGEKVVYRSVQPTLASLAIANSVDQTALVARRNLVQKAGGFDESLRRAVDYDLVLKISEHTTLRQVPYVGLRYSEDDADPNRISEFESKAWNNHVSDRHAWTAFRNAEARVPLRDDLITVIIDDVRSLADAREHLDYLHEHQDGLDVEVILIPHSGGWALRSALGALSHAKMDVRVLTTGFRNDRPRNLNAAIRVARGCSTLILEGRQHLFHGSIRTMLTRLAHASAVHPIVVGSTLLINNAGVIYPEHGSDPISFLRGMPTDILKGVSFLPVPGAPFPLAARSADLLAVEGATALLDSFMVDVDLSQKLARHTGQDVVVVPDMVVQQTASIWTARTGDAPDDVRSFKQLWPIPPGGSRRALETVRLDTVFNGFTALSFPTDPKRWSNAVLVSRATTVTTRDAPLRFAIRTAAPADERAVNWGDFHYGQSLANAFRRAGHAASVDYQPNADRGTSGVEDVVINLRGLRDIPIPSNATSVLWVLSHPDLVSAKEVEKYDLAYAASVSWSERQSQQWGIRINPLLQCTDPERFHPEVRARSDLADSIVMVGNSRRQFRPAAWHAANADYPVKIWGTLWEGMVPDECIVAQSLPNEELASYYRSARWTLNDHWSDMRDDGFISNRIFDVLASGGRLITDDVAGLAQVFGDRLAVFHSPGELLTLLDADPNSVYPSELVQELSAEVREHHSFDARAANLILDVREHRALRRARW